MSGLSKRSEKGLLTPDNCVVAMIDLQPQMLFGVTNCDRQAIIESNMILGKAARVFGLPVVLSTVETRSFSGNLWPQIRSIFPNSVVIERSSMNGWDDPKFVAAIAKTGRKKIVMAGLWTETCVVLPTVQAIHDGYEVYVVEDCCGDVSRLAHNNAMNRMIQAGAKPITSLSVLLEWQRDWAARDTYDAVMDIVKTHCGAYGIGVEYAYTMVHATPAAVLATYQVPLTGRAQIEQAWQVVSEKRKREALALLDHGVNRNASSETELASVEIGVVNWDSVTSIGVVRQRRRWPWNSIESLWRYWRRERGIKRAVHALEKFDDRTLRDMGIRHRSQIELTVRYCRDC